MKRCVLVLGAVLLFSGAAAAQDENPKAEVFAGYSYVRANASGTGFNLNGGSASVSFNPTSSLGIVTDFGGYHVGNIGGFSVDGNVYSYMFGPKLALRSGRVTPFVHALFGGAHATEGTFGVSENAFAMALGGGLDVNATDHIGIRLIQAEYFMTRFFSESQNNARISAGVVFRF